MIKTLTAHTAEIDDVDLAVSEIIEQINPEKNLLKNSVGFITCYSEFNDAGITEAVCKKLPFDIIGCTTLGAAVQGDMGQIMFSLAVLTSDDISFASGTSNPLSAETVKKDAADAYAAITSGKQEKPSMIFAFAPLTFNVAGDDIVEALDSASGGVPVFGTVSVDHTTDYHTARTIYNGKALKDSLCMVMIYGDIQPEFSIASVSDEKILGQKAMITRSESCTLKDVNGMSVITYLQSIGLAPNGKIEGLNAIPFIVDYNDGTKPVARAIFAITPEGEAVCGGVMPEKATLGIGYIDHDEVLTTTKNAMEQILKSQKKQGLFIFSCIVRNLVLGFDILAEMDIIKTKLKDKIPYIMSYSGGEICPVHDEQGRLVNRFHNDTIVTCLF